MTEVLAVFLSLKGYLALVQNSDPPPQHVRTVLKQPKTLGGGPSDDLD